MAFDIYAGGFARFYAQDWENVAQAHARRNGMQYQMIYAGGDPRPEKWEDVEKVVPSWRSALLKALGPHAPADMDWSEDRATRYFTDRPSWDGYSALVLLAAHTAFNEPLPSKLPEDALTAEIVLRTYDPQLRDMFRSVTKNQLWLPGSFDFSFDGVNLQNEKTHIGSVRRLYADLETIQEKHRISEATLEKSMTEAQGEDFLSIATYGLAVFKGVAKAALEHHLPIKPSF